MSIAGANSEASQQPELFFIRVEQFDGPIDLLLHLVKQNELPITKVSLGLVAEQYLNCLERLQDVEVEIVGEYLVIASTLLSIKARLVLCQPVDELMGDDDAFLEEDPHEVLLRRLREAAVYKDGADHLAERPVLGVDVFAPPGIQGGKVVFLSALKDHDPMLLGKALRALVKRKGVSLAPMTLQFDPVSVSERMQTILQILTDKKIVAGTSAIDFEELAMKVGGGLDMGVLITCFLALLELTRKRAIRIEQSAAFSGLSIMLPVDGAGGYVGGVDAFDSLEQEGLAGDDLSTDMNT
jgi:segregation and condensation protein A